MKKQIPAGELSWSRREIDQILDEPDFYGPSTHQATVGRRDTRSKWRSSAGRRAGRTVEMALKRRSEGGTHV